MFLKCHYTRPYFLHPMKNRAIHLEFLLQISISPKQRQENIKRLQVSSSNLPGTLVPLAKGTGKGPDLGGRGKEQLRWLFSSKHTDVSGGLGMFLERFLHLLGNGVKLPFRQSCPVKPLSSVNRPAEP